MEERKKQTLCARMSSLSISCIFASRTARTSIACTYKFMQCLQDKFDGSGQSQVHQRSLRLYHRLLIESLCTYQNGAHLICGLCGCRNSTIYGMIYTHWKPQIAIALDYFGNYRARLQMLLCC